MILEELKRKLYETDLSELYPDRERALERLTALIDGFGKKFGDRDGVMLLSVPGRSEICGNHTDHNGGVAIAAAINKDIVAVAARRTDGMVNVQSEGRREDSFSVDSASSPANFPRYKSIGLIAGVVRGFMDRGYRVGGFDAYTMTEVLSGSGLSSSAAFEVMIGNILNHLYNEGKIPSTEIAKIAQFAENEYFGKPSGLLDQMAAAVGGFVYLDFGGREAVVEPIDFSLSAAGYRLCIIGTGGSHSDLNEDYASIPREMKEVACALGKERLAGTTRCELMAAMPRLYRKLDDREILRAIHFVSECERVEDMHLALMDGDMEKVLRLHTASGHSSFEYLQNVYTTKHIDQGLSLAIALTERYLEGKGASVRVHGGGFAGTVQAIVPTEHVEDYRAFMDSVFGEGATMVLEVRGAGAVRII
ncbi:MAG: galactokinase [Clostridia bacterium]|nr:galactokinase [Clostridia bacterium]